MAKPVGITQELIENICAHIREGAPYGQAALLSGIGSDLMDRWRREGRRDAANNVDSLYRQLCEAMDNSRANYFRSLARIVNEAAIKDWTAAMTILERRDPSHWGRNNFKTEINIDSKASLSDQYKMILEHLNRGNMSTQEAAQRTQVLLNGAHLDEVSEFRKELEELKAKIAKNNGS